MEFIFFKTSSFIVFFAISIYCLVIFLFFVSSPIFTSTSFLIRNRASKASFLSYFSNIKPKVFDYKQALSNLVIWYLIISSLSLVIYLILFFFISSLNFSSITKSQNSKFKIFSAISSKE